MTSFRPNIPPHVADVIRSFSPELTQLIKSAIRTIAAKPECGVALQLELTGLRQYRVRQFSLVYAVHQKQRLIRVMAVSHRHYLHEGLPERIRHNAGA